MNILKQTITSLHFPISKRRLPYYSKALDWNIKVVYAPKMYCLGKYLPSELNQGKTEIWLSTLHQYVWLHELAHAAEDRIMKKQGSNILELVGWISEVVAEMSAALLCSTLYRNDRPRIITTMSEYIESVTPPEILREKGGVGGIVNLCLGNAEDLVKSISE